MQQKYEGAIHPKEFINSYWCPECGNTVNIHTNRFIKFELEYEQDVEVQCANVDFNVLCTKCDGYMIPIDNLLINHIKTLNANGITTMHCCAGHLNMYYSIREHSYRYYIDVPYISFANITMNNNAKDIAKCLLSMQEYGFIEYEEDFEKWTIRAKPCEIKHFSDIRNGFINMVSELVVQLTAGD